MSGSLFRNGGPHNVRRTGPDQYEMSISLPQDADGRTGRECPNGDCSPGYFKVRMGTGIADGQEVAYCPYCRREAEPSDFTTKAQVKYAEGIAMREAEDGVERMLSDALGLGSSGKKRYDAGMFSLEMSLKPGPRRHVSRPVGEELRRDVICPHCGLDHSVFGLATWCSDCGQDIFLTHVEAEYAVVQRMLSDVPRRRESLGARVAARDIENCLEDVVSISEAVLKALVARHLRQSGMSDAEVADVLKKKVGNRFQNVQRAADTFRNEFALDLAGSVEQDVMDALAVTFEKRHPITHNLGVIDRKYIERVQSAEREGREIRVTVEEVEKTIASATEVVRLVHGRLFNGA